MLDTDADPIASLVGRTLGGYTIEALLGQGGMSAVFRAHQASLQREVALKVLPPDKSQDREAVQRFIREARMLARLDHPNIVTVYDVGEADGLAYIAMRLIDGPTLAEVIPRDGLPPARVDRIVRQIAAALDYVHAQGLIHRDVKAGNVMLEAGDTVMLTDFGIAAARRLQGRAEPLEGTAEYVAPEVARGSPATARSDVYALGVLTFEMLVGHLPFTGPDARAVMRQHLTAPPPPIGRSKPGLSSQADRVVRSAMAKEPSARYATASDFARALHAALTDQAPIDPVARAGEPTRPLPPPDGRPVVVNVAMPSVGAHPRRRKGWLIGFAVRLLAGLIAFALGAGAVAYAWNNVDLSGVSSLLASPASRSVAAAAARPSPTAAPAALPTARGVAATPTTAPAPTATSTAPPLVAVEAATPQEAMQGYYDALLAKDYPKAYSYWSAERRRTVPYQAGLVDAETPIKTFAFQFWPVPTNDGTVVERVRRSNVLATGRQDVITDWLLVKEASGWRLDRELPQGQASSGQPLVLDAQAPPASPSKPGREARGREKKGD